MTRVRRLRPGEGALYRRLRLDSLRETPSGFETSLETALERTDASWSEQADATARGSDRATFLALAGERPVGIAALYRDRRSAELGHLLQVWVAPEARGRGVGTRLVDAVVAWAKDHAFRKIVTTIRMENREVAPFFRRLGFDPLAAPESAGRDGFVLTLEP